MADHREDYVKEGDYLLQDEHIQEWIKEYGGVTSYTFLVYGEVDNRDLMMIQQGLTLRLVQKATTT